MGVQVLAAPLREETMLRVAFAYEQGHELRPVRWAVP
jgi:Asp-tRNA(Asn)/Glu-tRNA(Gln) amidotransferase A subunit family amidase